MQLLSPDPAETMGKITVTLQRVMFKQALKEHIKDLRCTRLCAWPAKSLTPNETEELGKDTYVIQ